MSAGGLQALIAVLGITQAKLERTGVAQAQEGQAGLPVFEVEPYWPNALPNNWTFRLLKVCWPPVHNEACCLKSEVDAGPWPPKDSLRGERGCRTRTPGRLSQC
jgi:hypothetical protein